MCRAVVAGDWSLCAGADLKSTPGGQPVPPASRRVGHRHFIDRPTSAAVDDGAEPALASDLAVPST